MKTKRIISILGIMIMLAMSACSNQGGGNKQSLKEALVYTCPMHPEVVSDKPDTCPKCGMELVIKEKPSDTVQGVHGNSAKTIKQQ